CDPALLTGRSEADRRIRALARRGDGSGRRLRVCDRARLGARRLRPLALRRLRRRRSGGAIRRRRRRYRVRLARCREQAADHQDCRGDESERARDHPYTLAHTRAFADPRRIADSVRIGPRVPPRIVRHGRATSSHPTRLLPDPTPSPPTGMSPDPPAAPAGLRAHGGPLAWRVAAGALVATGRASPAAIGIAGLVAAPALFEPPILLRLLIGASLLPGLVGWLLQRAFAAEVAVRDGVLQLRRRDLEVDVPRGSIASVAPWWLPLPGPGFSLALRSGARLRERVQAADPTPILVALAAHGIEPARTALRHPALAFAHAREAARGGW